MEEIKKLLEAKQFKQLSLIHIQMCIRDRSKEDAAKADIVLLGPQVRYLEKKMNERVNHEKPVMVIDMAAYGMMNGAKVLDDALALLNK